MEKLLVFGHKSPDTDSIASSIAMAFLQTKLGKTAVPYRLGNISKETEFALDYFKVGAPDLLEKLEENSDVILVDHNEPAQSADGIENSNIKMVVDHHRISGFNTADPLYYYAEPVGCTSTILYKLFKAHSIEIPSYIAGLMVSAIISDTLLFKSPTCTTLDKVTAEALAKIAGIDLEKYGLALLKAGTDLSGFTAKELVNLDAKQVTLADKVKAKICQVNTADIDEVMVRKSEIESALLKEKDELGLDLVFFLITDIINSNSQVITFGNNELVEKSYSVKVENNTAFLPGVVSRKKQVIPVLTANVD